MDNIQLAPLQFEGYYVRELTFTQRPGLEEILFSNQPGLNLQREGLFNPGPLTVNVQTGIAPHIENPQRWLCLLEITSHIPAEVRFPYDFKTVLVGYFIVHEQVPVEDREAMVKISGSSVLYSAARDLLASITGRGPYPGVVLPVIHFGLGSEPEEQRTATSKREASEEGKNEPKKATKKRATKKAGGKKQQR